MSRDRDLNIIVGLEHAIIHSLGPMAYELSMNGIDYDLNNLGDIPRLYKKMIEDPEFEVIDG